VTGKLLPLTTGNFTVSNIEKLTLVLNIGTNNHNIYDNLAAQILTAKLNIKNHVPACEKLDDAIRYGDQKVRLVNYNGPRSVTLESTNNEMRNMITAHTTISQFNSHGCFNTIPTGIPLFPNFHSIILMTPLGLFVN